MFDLFASNGLFVVIVMPTDPYKVMEHTPRVAHQLVAENGYSAVKSWLSKHKPHLSISKFERKRGAEVYHLSGQRTIKDFGLGEFVSPLDFIPEM